MFVLLVCSCHGRDGRLGEGVGGNRCHQSADRSHPVCAWSRFPPPDQTVWNGCSKLPIRLAGWLECKRWRAITVELRVFDSARRVRSEVGCAAEFESLHRGEWAGYRNWKVVSAAEARRWQCPAGVEVDIGLIPSTWRVQPREGVQTSKNERLEQISCLGLERGAAPPNVGRMKPANRLYTKYYGNNATWER